MIEGSDQEKKKPLKGFGVDADIEHNQLLIWANDAEMERVRELLVKLGETPGPQRSSSPVRVILPSDAKATAALLEQLRAAWPATGGNELIIKAPSQPKPAPAEDQEKKDQPKPDPTTKTKDERAAATKSSARTAARFVELQTAGVAPADEKPESDAANAVTGPAASPATPAAIATAPVAQTRLSTQPRSNRHRRRRLRLRSRRMAE